MQKQFSKKIKIGKHLTRIFYLAKLFKQSRRADVKFTKKHQRKQVQDLKIRVMKRYIPMHIKRCA
jgi:hypothetical protein